MSLSIRDRYWSNSESLSSRNSILSSVYSSTYSTIAVYTALTVYSHSISAHRNPDLAPSAHRFRNLPGLARSSDRILMRLSNLEFILLSRSSMAVNNIVVFLEEVIANIHTFGDQEHSLNKTAWWNSNWCLSPTKGMFHGSSDTAPLFWEMGGICLELMTLIFSSIDVASSWCSGPWACVDQTVWPCVVRKRERMSCIWRRRKQGSHGHLQLRVWYCQSVIWTSTCEGVMLSMGFVSFMWTFTDEGVVWPVETAPVVCTARDRQRLDTPSAIKTQRGGVRSMRIFSWRQMWIQLRWRRIRSHHGAWSWGMDSMLYGRNTTHVPYNLLAT